MVNFLLGYAREKYSDEEIDALVKILDIWGKRFLFWLRLSDKYELLTHRVTNKEKIQPLRDKVKRSRLNRAKDELIREEGIAAEG